MNLSRSEISFGNNCLLSGSSCTKFNPSLSQVSHIHMAKQKPLSHDTPVHCEHLQGERIHFYVQRAVEGAGIKLMVLSHKYLRCSESLNTLLWKGNGLRAEVIQPGSPHSTFQCPKGALQEGWRRTFPRASSGRT